MQAKKHQEELSQSEEAHLKTKRDYESAMALAEERNILLQKNTEYYEEKIKAIIKEVRPCAFDVCDVMSCRRSCYKILVS